MAKAHYENFVVGSVLVPRRYMQHLYNIYAFCRHADDLADETGDHELSIRLLAEWREQLKACYGGRPEHPILIALQDTIDEFDIPMEPFEDLISAFEQDCRVTRYATYADLLSYCERSANPVGRIFLWVFGYKDDERLKLSDKICTALQLANFWQDVASDFERGRVYIPQEDMSIFGCSESDIGARRMTPDFKELIRFEVDRAQEMFREGAPLPSMVNRRLSIDIGLFKRGGMAVLDGIRKIDYDVMSHRPVISKRQKARLFLGCLFGG